MPCLPPRARATGVTTAPLPDGPTPGTNYIVAAAVIAPLSPGTHTIDFGGDFIPGDSPFSGDTFVGGDTITVVPEPASTALLGLAAVCALRHRRQQR